MCGIFGCVGKITYEKAEECIARISHRGPDAQAVRQLPEITLAHARLSIVDTSEEANQPMKSFDGRYWIVFNGEIYNYIELRNELIEIGYNFSTRCDTEVLLYAYMEWGEKFQNKCNGMWALAIWDCMERKLFLSRDRFGIKPLYYMFQDGNFYFASEMKAFFPILRKRTPNYKIFDEKHYFAYEATSECVIKEIKRFPAGNCGVLNENGLNKHKWWETLGHLIDTPKNYKEQVEMFRDLFLDACKIRMRSDVPIGTALSGGVDSSAVIGMMHYIAKNREDQYVNKSWQNAFVASMPNTKYDETEGASIAAKHIGLEVNKVKVFPNIGEKQLLQYIYMCEDPYITSPVVFLQTYGAIRNKGIKVTLDGHGADEMFGGYGFDIPSAVNECRYDEDKTKEILAVYNNMLIPEQHIEYDQLLNKARYVDYGELIDPEYLSEWENMDQFNRKLFIETHKTTLPTLFRCYDRYSMANGVEIRMPFMDYRIVSFAFSIPWTSKLRNGFTKAIVRDMARPFMSEKIMNQKLKIGFNSPMLEWFRGELKEFLIDTICSKDFFECDLINPLRIHMKVEEFYKTDENNFYKAEEIWKLIVPYLWKKAVLDR